MKRGVILISVSNNAEEDDKRDRVAYEREKSHYLSMRYGNKPFRPYLQNPHRTGGWVLVSEQYITRVMQPQELVDHLLVEGGLLAGELGVGDLFDLVGQIGQQPLVGLGAAQDERLGDVTQAVTFQARERLPTSRGSAPARVRPDRQATSGGAAFRARSGCEACCCPRTHRRRASSPQGL